MTPFSLLLAAFLALPAAAGSKFSSALEPGGKTWAFELDADALTVTPPGETRPAQRLELHRSDTPPDEPLVELMDLDFDGIRDVRVLLAKHGQGQTVWQYFLFDKKTSRFVPNPQLDATLNARPDTEGGKHLLSAYWNGGAAGRIYRRRVYRWQGRRLLMTSEIDQLALPGRPDDFRKVVKKRISGGLKTVEDTIVHDPH
jgi:hypothetical protein